MLLPCKPLPCNFQEKAARFALLASVGGHGKRELMAARGLGRAAKKNPGNLQISKKNENPEATSKIETSRIETSRLGTQKDTREKSSAFSCL
ncbi:TPA: hypothetical protein HA351_10220 [Methanosarcinaceae archaeon]|nr:hypothetical protein [Methanosarcinaceae archaeon]